MYRFIGLALGVFAASCYIESVKKKTREEKNKIRIEIPEKAFELKDAETLEIKKIELEKESKKEDK